MRELWREGKRSRATPFYGALTAALLAVTFIREFSLLPPRLAGYLQ